MGRYYYGDIEGKFWFAVQSSDAPERFGCEKYEPSIIHYYTQDENRVLEEINIIKDNLGKYKEALDNYFSSHFLYNNNDLLEFLIDYFFKNKTEEEKEKERKSIDINYILSEYADLELGEKILKCIKENGHCDFEAEY